MMSRSFAAEYQRLVREVEAMAEMLRVLMTQVSQQSEQIKTLQAQSNGNQQRRSARGD